MVRVCGGWRVRVCGGLGCVEGGGCVEGQGVRRGEVVWRGRMCEEGGCVGLRVCGVRVCEMWS